MTTHHPNPFFFHTLGHDLDVFAQDFLSESGSYTSFADFDPQAPQGSHVVSDWKLAPGHLDRNGYSFGDITGEAERLHSKLKAED